MGDLQFLLSLQVAVGYGVADFPMNKGSFKYKEKLQWKHNLIMGEPEKKGFGYSWEVKDPKTLRTGNVNLIFNEEGDAHITFELDSMAANRFWVTFSSEETEHIYGCGETFSEFDLKGQAVRVWVAEHQNSKRISKKILKEKIIGKRPKKKQAFRNYESYYAQPTFVSSEGYVVHVDGTAFMDFDFRKKDSTTLYIREVPDIYVKAGDSYEELSLKLGELVGHQPTMPDWLYDGVIIAIQEGTERIQEKIDLARKAGVPVVGVWSQDWCGCRRTGFGYQVMWNWAWDKELYHNLDEKIKEWKKEGIRFLGYINPFMAIEKEIYKEASEKGYCVKDKEGKDYLVTITTFPAAMIDFTNPAAYDWYKELIKKNLIGLGLGGWMADFGEYLPTDCVLYSGEDPEKVHNTWPAIWAKLNREAISECGVEDEVFFFTRAGYTGTVKASTMMWNGDQHVDWSIDDGLPSVIPATLSLAMSGYGLTHSDIGGYTTIMHMRRSKELLMRWCEMNAFTPLMRSHEGNQPVNNVQLYDDTELLTHLARMTELHVALKEYLKDAVEKNAKECVPVMRPLFYHYKEADAYTEMTEYLLGRDILVAPIMEEGAKMRRVYFPKDRWIHIFSGKVYEGGSYEVEAPMGQPPVFIREEAYGEACFMRLLQLSVGKEG